MRKETIEYTDYNGNKRSEDHYFHLTEAEVAKMELGVKGGLSEMLSRLVELQDQPAIIKVLEDIIQKSYGVKTLDGKGFDKDPKHLKEFMMTEAYSKLFMKLAFDADAAAQFLTGILPADLAKRAAELAEKNAVAN